MSDDWTFVAAVFSAQQKGGKALAQVIQLLRADHPLTAEDKRALADYLLEALTAPKKRGARPQPMFSPTWHMRRIVAEVRRVADRDEITHKEAIKRVLEREERVTLIGSEGVIEQRKPRFSFEQILQEVKRRQ
jgi:hypothetical protein